MTLFKTRGSAPRALHQAIGGVKCRTGAPKVGPVHLGACNRKPHPLPVWGCQPRSGIRKSAQLTKDRKVEACLSPPAWHRSAKFRQDAEAGRPPFPAEDTPAQYVMKSSTQLGALEFITQQNIEPKETNKLHKNVKTSRKPAGTPKRDTCWPRKRPN